MNRFGKAVVVGACTIICISTLTSIIAAVVDTARQNIEIRRNAKVSQEEINEFCKDLENDPKKGEELGVKFATISLAKIDKAKIEKAKIEKAKISKKLN